MSGAGFDIGYESTRGHDWHAALKTELWLMKSDGSNKRRLTHFNEPGYPEYMGGRRCIVSDSAWSPDGKRIVFCQGASERGPWELYVIPSSGGPPERLTEGGSDMYPDWR